MSDKPDQPNMIRWKPARDGFVESHDGRWRISPLYWGCTRPQVYELTYDGKAISSYNATQREAKDAAERHASEPQQKKRKSR